jgi:two-component system nitrogen regulation response regulator NtrX
MKHRLLVVDDEAGVRAALKQVLEFDGHEVRTANSGAQAVMLYPDVRPQVVFLDVKMAGLDGLDTLSQLLEGDPSAVVIMISGHATIATAIEATRRGAFDFLEKPLDSDRLLVTLRNALGRSKLAGSYQRLRQESDARYQMVGESLVLRQVREMITRVAPTTGRVLITGENGSGKELVARAIHEGSPRSSQPFVEVNCAAIPSELIESELFGHLKGSFTGAVTDRAGKFEQADGGTLFLDEIGDMALPAQAKVLRALQEGVITRIGGAKSIQVDVRVIAATNKNLELEIREGRFREDLFYRLNVVPIHVPALRERRGDIPILVTHFVKQLAGGAGGGGRNFDAAGVEALTARPWPGNVRELRNAVERLLILSSGRRISTTDVGRLLGGHHTGPALEAAAFEAPYVAFMDRAEKLYIEVRLRENNGKIAETARAIDIPRSSLYKKMERHGLIKADE